MINFAVRFMVVPALSFTIASENRFKWINIFQYNQNTTIFYYWYIYKDICKEPAWRFFWTHIFPTEIVLPKMLGFAHELQLQITFERFAFTFHLFSQVCTRHKVICLRFVHPKVNSLCQSQSKCVSPAQLNPEVKRQMNVLPIFFLLRAVLKKYIYKQFGN